MTEKKSSPLYEEVAAKIAALIEQGTLPVGGKMPSLRRYSRQWGASVFTVTEAYNLLQNWGMVESRPQSGFYVVSNTRVPALQPPQFDRLSRFHTEAPTPLHAEITSVSEKMVMPADPNILFLGIPNLDTSLLPTTELEKAFRTAPQRVGLKGYEYNWPPGNESLRVQLARHYLDCGWALSPNDIVTTAGCEEAFQLCLRAIGAQPGDVIAVESPIFLFCILILEALKLRILEIPSHPVTGMNLDYLEKALKHNKVKACLSIPTFNNPLGSLMPDENKRRLVDILAKREIPLVENDMYGDLSLGATRPKPAKAFDTKGLVMLISSFSKSLALGLRVGWVVPGRWYSEVKTLKVLSNMAGNAFTESAMAQFMEKGGYKRHLRRMRIFYTDNLRAYNQAIFKFFPEGTRMSRPAGGYVLWVEFPPAVDSLRLFREALEQKIHVCMGPACSAQGKYKNYILLCCGYAYSPRIEKALETIGTLAKKQLA